MRELVDRWRSVVPEKLPYVLEQDRDILLRQNCGVVFDSYHSFISSGYLFNPEDARFHFGLVPIPYIGDLSRARIFILMLNPGFKPMDYFAEYECKAYREIVWKNLHQRNDDQPFPFHYLDPRFAWGPGAEYWRKRFHWLAKAEAVNYEDYLNALRLIASVVACLQLIPYHSPSFSLSERIIERLESVNLIRDYVHSELLARAKRDEVLLIVTRQSKKWGLVQSKNIVVYEGAEPRGAHISPNTNGGQAVRSFYKRLQMLKASG